MGLAALSLSEAPGQAWPCFPAGFLLYAALDRLAFPLCSSCRQSATPPGPPSHGPLLLLVLALSLHNLLDGVLLATRPDARWAILLHRIPESFVLYWLLASVAPTRLSSLLAFASLQGATWLGFELAAHLPYLNESTLLASGALLYLAWHGLHETYARSPRLLWLSGASASLVLAWTFS